MVLASILLVCASAVSGFGGRCHDQRLRISSPIPIGGYERGFARPRSDRGCTSAAPIQVCFTYVSPLAVPLAFGLTLFMILWREHRALRRTSDSGGSTSEPIRNRVTGLDIGAYSSRLAAVRSAVDGLPTIRGLFAGASQKRARGWSRRFGIQWDVTRVGCTPYNLF